MNTQTVILFGLFSLAALYGVYWLIKKIVKSKDRESGVILTIVLACYLGILFLLALSGLNAMGYARLTVFNTVKQRGPRPQAPVEYVAPPVQAPLQPSSKPAIDQHREDMEQIKRNGL